MKLIRGLHNLPQALKGSVITLGNFDGIHLGHQALISQLKEESERYQVPSVVVTFEPPPKEFFAGRETAARMMRLSEKIICLRQWGVDYLCCLYFDADLSQMSAQDFIQTILIDKLAAKSIIVGYDFRFGAARQGNFALLEALGDELGYQAIELPGVTLSGEIVSSTRLRSALSDGNMVLANQLLGRPYRLRGKVCYGHQRGRDLGFPTANINLHRELVPISGVFVIRAYLGDETFDGVANVGVRPTFDGSRVLLEAHLFEFNRMIYGANLEVEFLHQLRPEKRFDDFNLLVKQIHQDVLDAKEFLIHYN